MTKLELCLYAMGMCASIYIGMYIENHRLAKRYKQNMLWEFRRGYEAGKNHLPRALKERSERDSAVRVLDLPDEYFEEGPYDWERDDRYDHAR